ncbi:MAG: PSD1 domain-containing protein [Planctomycetaceae bacterium]|nr:PSD1 domain-containing protein [Planctomycetaceae bacterium]
MPHRFENPVAALVFAFAAAFGAATCWPAMVCCAADTTDAPAPTEAVDFVADVQPIFIRACSRCHGPEKQRSGYRLDVRDGALRGGELYAPNIIPGDASASRLVEFISAGGELEMPPEGPPLSPAEIETIRAWIDQGAQWPDAVAGQAVDKAEWWAWQPLARPAAPEVRPSESGPARVANPIDQFVVAKLHDNGLVQAPRADRRVLIRRLSFDLIGLPPTPEEIDAFVADDDPLAYERLVDRLLASPRYGERWARHWMDAAHFAETHGHDQDRIREHAWRYRDYLIESFNADKSFRQFIQEQVAGDALFPDDPQATIALGFLAAGPWDESSLRDIQDDTVDRQIARYLDRDDMLSTVMNNVVSLTVQCARCHDHKFDPISQQEYYQLQAVFAGVDRANRTVDVSTEVGRKRRELLARKHALENGADEERLSDSEAHRREALEQTTCELAALPAPLLTYAAASQFEPDGGLKPPPGPRPIHLLQRGEIGKPLQLVPPGALSCIAALRSQFDVPEGSDESARRAALALWLTDARNPLTWRSIVNRVWHHHVGAGIVTTLNDFGHMGAAPSHPELLDWLAAEFRDGNQSLKDLHRLIVTSETYRQTSRIAAIDSTVATHAASADVGNRLLWRMNRTRLDAECVHDAILASTGRLDLRMGGPSDRQFALTPGHHVTPIIDYRDFDVDSDAARRRSVYRFLFRTLPDPFQDALDCPSGDQITPVRGNSVTVQQALALWNNAFVLRQAELLAMRLANEAGTTAEQIELAVELTLGRAAADERRSLTEYAEEHGMANACRLLLNANEFVFVD